SKQARAKNSSTSATDSRPSPCQPQNPRAQAASTGQSCTHCNGGGVLVAPWSSRGSSLINACRKASNPAADNCGAKPSRHTFRQLSMFISSALGRRSRGFQPPVSFIVVPEFIIKFFTCKCQVVFRKFFKKNFLTT